MSNRDFPRHDILTLARQITRVDKELKVLRVYADELKDADLLQGVSDTQAHLEQVAKYVCRRLELTPLAEQCYGNQR